MGSRVHVWSKAAGNWSTLCATMGCATIRVPGGIAHVYEIGRSGTFHNFVLVADPRCFSLDSVEKLFSKRELPFSIKMPNLKSYTQLRESLNSQGYSLLPVWCLMKNERIIGKRNPEVDVRETGTTRALDWIVASSIGDLGQNSKIVRQEMIKRASRDSSLRLLLGSLCGRPAGVGMLYLKGAVASIHMMSTLPEFRRKHVATTIVLHALDGLKNERTDLVWLRTRKGGAGEKVYVGIGFESVLDILTYTRTPDLEDGIDASQSSIDMPALSDPAP